MGSLKEKVAAFLYRSRWGEKLLMTANIWVNDWHLSPPNIASFFPKSNALEEYSKRADELFADLDELSRKTVKNYFWRETMLPESKEAAYFFMYNFPRALSAEERKEDRKARKLLWKLRKKYFLNDCNVDAESLVYHHGLSAMPEKVLSYIKGKDFIDAGACFGDSALVFANYAPRKIYAFEPSPENGKIFRRTMDKNRIPENIYELVPAGLASQKGEIFFSDIGDSGNNLMEKGETKAELVTLDEFVRERDANIGVIKADLEGMGLDMLKGAKETLVKCRPVLSLSIYHNEEELFGTYPLLKEWLPDYHFYIRSFSLPSAMGEVSLLGCPEELLK